MEMEILWWRKLCLQAVDTIYFEEYVHLNFVRMIFNKLEKFSFQHFPCPHTNVIQILSLLPYYSKKKVFLKKRFKRIKLKEIE